MKNNKRRILTVITIATLSAITITGCNKEDKSADKQINEVVETDTESTNEEIDANESATDSNTDVEESKEEGDSTDSLQGEESSEETTESDTDKSEVSDKSQTNSSDTAAEVELPIYTMNDETLETEDVMAYVSKDTKITAEVIVNKVIETFSANSYEVKVQSVTQKDDTVIVNFEENSAPVTGVGASVEGTTLDCISYSLLDNLSTCKKVIFRIDGEAYVSGHIEMGINEPYITGNTN